MWQVFCGLIAIDKGWSAYEDFNSNDKHKMFKGCLDLAGMCVAICYICGQVNFARMFQGKPPKH